MTHTEDTLSEIITFEIEDLLASNAELYHIPPRQHQPDNAFVYLTAYGTVGTMHRCGTGYTVDEAYGLTQTFTVSANINTKELYKFLKSPAIVALLEKIYDNHDVELNGNNNVGVLSDEGRDAVDSFEELLNSIDEVAVWDVADAIGYDCSVERLLTNCDDEIEDIETASERLYNACLSNDITVYGGPEEIEDFIETRQREENNEE